jgi:hypothetical protein
VSQKGCDQLRRDLVQDRSRAEDRRFACPGLVLRGFGVLTVDQDREKEQKCRL